VYVQKTDTYDIFTSIIITAILTTRDNYIQELEKARARERAIDIIFVYKTSIKRNNLPTRRTFE